MLLLLTGSSVLWPSLRFIAAYVEHGVGATCTLYYACAKQLTLVVTSNGWMDALHAVLLARQLQLQLVAMEPATM